MESFNQLEPLLKSFWLIAIPSSIIFLFQSIMTFAGGDTMDGTEADFDSNLHDTDSPFQLFSLRNLIHFLLGFSWSGISFYQVIHNKFLLVAVALAVGVLFVLLFFFIIQKIQRLAEDNTFQITDTLHKTAEVYLAIPAAKGGRGKVQISVKGAFHELSAMTAGDRIETGAAVRIVGIESNSIVVVEKI